MHKNSKDVKRYNPCYHYVCLMPPAGFEPATHSLGNRLGDALKHYSMFQNE